MAVQKVYAVKKGKKTGVFLSWPECKAAVDGFSGAEYKGFSNKEEALRYLGKLPEAEAVGTASDLRRDKRSPQEAASDLRQEELPPEGTLLAYVDGSYSDALKKYAFGCVFILPDGRIYTEFGNGDQPASLEQRNVAGEMLGAMYAAKCAMLNGYQAVEICYDYQGIEKWVTGEWRSKTELTKKYAQTMREWGQSIRMSFTKVAAHSNVRFNELADQTAKRGLTEAAGVPKIKKLEEMTAHGKDTPE
ncbi:MAG: ribonuclease H family protein [Candidatus Gastranaerophilales bacterium]|nr:ribonuclease H family protein [Candidatus Gastranaerophilales bacterium]